MKMVMQNKPFENQHFLAAVRGAKHWPDIIVAEHLGVSAIWPRLRGGARIAAVECRHVVILENFAFWKATDVRKVSMKWSGGRGR